MRAPEWLRSRAETRNFASVVMHALSWVTNTVSELAQHVTLSRLGYSVVILLVIAVLLKSLVVTWQSGKITIGDFDYYADGAKKVDFGEQMRAETFEFYNLIVRLIQQEAERTKYEDGHGGQKEENDKSGRLPPIRNEQLADLSNKSGELQQLEVTVQGVNIKNLFSASAASSRQARAS